MFLPLLPGSFPGYQVSKYSLPDQQLCITGIDRQYYMPIPFLPVQQYCITSPTNPCLLLRVRNNEKRNLTKECIELGNDATNLVVSLTAIICSGCVEITAIIVASKAARPKNDRCIEQI